MSNVKLKTKTGIVNCVSIPQAIKKANQMNLTTGIEETVIKNGVPFTRSYKKTGNDWVTDSETAQTKTKTNEKADSKKTGKKSK